MAEAASVAAVTFTVLCPDPVRALKDDIQLARRVPLHNRRKHCQRGKTTKTLQATVEDITTKYGTRITKAE